MNSNHKLVEIEDKNQPSLNLKNENNLSVQ